MYKKNYFPLSFHPLLPPALHTSLHFCALCLNSSHAEIQQAVEVSLSGVLILPWFFPTGSFLQCLCPLGIALALHLGCKNFHSNRKWYESPFGLSVFSGLLQQLCFCQLFLVAPLYSPTTPPCTYVTVLFLGLHFSKVFCD